MNLHPSCFSVIDLCIVLDRSSKSDAGIILGQDIDSVILYRLFIPLCQLELFKIVEDVGY